MGLLPLGSATLNSPSFSLFPMFVLLAISLGAFALFSRKRELSLPPGPKPLPVIGNLFDVPLIKPWIVYEKWAQTYGSDVLCMQLPSQPVIILNSAQVAGDLLGERSNIYGDKPRALMDKLLGWDWAMSSIPYGQRWTYARKYFHQSFNGIAVQQYRDVQQREVRRFLQRTLMEQDRKANMKSVTHPFATVILEITYGIQIQSLDDPVVVNIREALETFSEIKVPGAFWVEAFPFLRHLPRWTPGAAFHRYIDLNRPKVLAARERPFGRTLQDIARNFYTCLRFELNVVKSIKNDGTAPPSMVHDLVQALREEYSNKNEYYEHEAAVETTHSTICWFIVAMAMYPQVQEKAQRELDRVIGADRLPVHEDYDSLPYIQGVMLESLRWVPGLPIGIPHRSMVDDEYRGYRIPKNSTMVPNTWNVSSLGIMMQDSFDPERYLDKEGRINPEVRDPSTIVFGFGRRMCAGRYFAKEAIFLTIASILHVFNIQPALDEDGKPMQLSIAAAAPESGLFLHPKRLDCTLAPRSDKAVKVIGEVYE
ncbi:hypothetical protein NM688_g2640 [Phlebia brevispora]|uniref:Uncharacterized protein n=1 Tax=Phlebia brevispora TaxID=194682 RepID=A0ACC1T8B0_9APHY|nr:hypothetical protein NM688_g2640 [Phlebia brevispora]